MEENENALAAEPDLTDAQVVMMQNEEILEQNREILSILRPLAAFVQEDLPRLSEQAGPMIERIKSNPMLKAFL